MSGEIKPTDIAEVVAKREAPHGWALLHSKLPPAAIKALSESVYGVAGLSDVNEGFLIQRLFAADLGWEWRIMGQQYLGAEDRQVRGKDYTMRYYLAAVRGILTIDGRQFHGTGAHDNRKLDAAFKGAATVAFKNACKLAGLTIELFKDGKAMDFIYEDRQGNAATPVSEPAPSPTNGAGTVPPSAPNPPANSEAPPSAPPLPSTGEIGDVAVLYELGASLPHKSKTRPEIDGLLKELGYEKLRRNLENQHHLQCGGAPCEHIKAARAVMAK